MQQQAHHRWILTTGQHAYSPHLSPYMPYSNHWEKALFYHFIYSHDMNVWLCIDVCWEEKLDVGQCWDLNKGLELLNFKFKYKTYIHVIIK